MGGVRLRVELGEGLCRRGGLGRCEMGVVWWDREGGCVVAICLFFFFSLYERGLVSFRFGVLTCNYFGLIRLFLFFFFEAVVA